MHDNIYNSCLVESGHKHDGSEQQCRLINRQRLEAMTGFSRSLIYSKLNPKDKKYYDPRFPRQIVTGKRQVRWVESEVINYIRQLIEEGRK